MKPSVFWHCWLCGRKGIRPVKTEWWGAGMVICLERCADLHMAQLIPLPLTVSCFRKIQIGFTFLVPAHPGSPGQRAVLGVWVCVCVLSGWRCIWQKGHAVFCILAISLNRQLPVNHVMCDRSFKPAYSSLNTLQCLYTVNLWVR